MGHQGNVERLWDAVVSQPHPKIWDDKCLPLSCAAFRLCRNGETVVPLLISHDAEVQDASTRGHALSRVSMSGSNSVHMAQVFFLDLYCLRSERKSLYT